MALPLSHGHARDRNLRGIALNTPLFSGMSTVKRCRSRLWATELAAGCLQSMYAVKTRSCSRSSSSTFAWVPSWRDGDAERELLSRRASGGDRTFAGVSGSAPPSSIVCWSLYPQSTSTARQAQHGEGVMWRMRWRRRWCVAGLCCVVEWENDSATALLSERAHTG